MEGGGREVSGVDAVVAMVLLVVGSGIVMVGKVRNVDDEVAKDVVVDDDEDELVDELEVDARLLGDELMEVEPACVRAPAGTVARLLRSTGVTSGRSTPLVPGIVLDSSGTVEEGKTSVRVPPPGLISCRTATSARTASNTSGIALLSIRSTPHVP